MDREKTVDRMAGCFLSIPTLFHDDGALNLAGVKQHVGFLLAGGLCEDNGVLLTCGAAGDFPCLTPGERIAITEAVLEETSGKIGVILGAQTSSAAEAIKLTQAAERIGADAVQLSPPYYHEHSEEDICEFMTRIAESADVGVLVYPTPWTASDMSLDLIDRLIEKNANIVGLKWSAPSNKEYLKGIWRFVDRVCIIDNQICFVSSHVAGVRGFNTHTTNYWPQWGVKLMGLLNSGKYDEAHQEVMTVLLPYYDLCAEVGQATGGEGIVDKMCLELIGLNSSSARLPTRDVRDQYRDKVRKMLERTGVPGLK